MRVVRFIARKGGIVTVPFVFPLHVAAWWLSPWVLVSVATLWATVCIGALCQHVDEKRGAT